MQGRPGQRRAGGLAVVGQAGGGRRQHEQDGADEHDVGRGRLADQVEDDDPQQHADRDVRRRGMERVSQPPAVEQIPDRMDRSEQGLRPTPIELPQRPGPAVVHGHESGQQVRHRPPPSAESTPMAGRWMLQPRRAYHIAIHIPSTSVGKSGISRRRFRRSSWIRPLWPRRGGGYCWSCPKGQVRTARPHRGAILGTVPGAGFGSRKAIERGARAERRDSGLVRSRCETTSGPPTSSFGRFRVSGMSPDRQGSADRPTRVRRHSPREWSSAPTATQLLGRIRPGNDAGHGSGDGPRARGPPARVTRRAGRLRR